MGRSGLAAGPLASSRTIDSDSDSEPRLSPPGRPARQGSPDRPDSGSPVTAGPARASERQSDEQISRAIAWSLACSFKKQHSTGSVRPSTTTSIIFFFSCCLPFFSLHSCFDDHVIVDSSSRFVIETLPKKALSVSSRFFVFLRGRVEKSRFPCCFTTAIFSFREKQKEVGQR